MDNDKLKQMFPFLKNVDLDDPRQKKQFAAILGLVAMGILVLVLALMSAAKKKETQAPTEDRKAKTDVAQQTGTDKPKRKTELLELPQGDNAAEDGVLSSPNMISARERQRNAHGSSLKDLYGQTQYGDDPMAVLTEKDEDYSEEAGSSSIDRIRKMYMPSDDSEEDDGDVQVKPEQTPVKKKTINRGTVTPVTESSQPYGMVQPQNSRPFDPPSRVTNSSLDEDYYGVPVSTPPSDTSTVKAEETAPKTIRKSGGISSLDDWGTVDGIGGLDEEDQYVTVDASKPVKVMFVRDQKITSGQRVFLRLLDDIAADGMLIPRNTHLSAQCSIGERLQIKVNNIEINGKIVNLGYTAFDNDGNEGLNCPESTAKQSVDQAANTAVNIGQSLLQSRVTGIAGQIINSGTSIVRSTKGKITAQVNAGYTFFLLKDEF